MQLPCFKGYDIRCRVPDELDETLARKIGLAMSNLFGSRPVVLGRDVRCMDDLTYIPIHRPL